ncbi:ABC transporter substrate-binding protein [Muricoccus radiodurans]|uniref:ABC transporter substrate-binding protein n=1 Tax=Muricoccus radiodurans TaxID=2231721 RepID=UPI003CF0A17B
MKRSLISAVAALLAWPALAQPADQPRIGGTMTIVLNADIRSTEPGINRDGNTDTVMHVVAETLVAHRADLSVGPLLASRWVISEDGATYTFTLRAGARFHNGQPVTSEHVRWLWERRMGTNPAWPCKRIFTSRTLNVTAVEAPAPDTVVFRLQGPSAVFLPWLASPQCNFAPVHPDSIGADGAWRAPIATGPYRLAEWRPGQFIRLERFAAYVPLEEESSGYAGARRAYLNEVRFRVIPDAAAAEAALYSGEVDLLTDLPALRAQGARNRRMQVANIPGLGWNTLLLNTRDPLLRDVRVRRAIAHAIDRAAIAEARTGSAANAGPSVVPRPSAFFGPEFEAWPAYDPARARALLREAGYGGQVLRIQTNRRYDGMYESAVLVQAMLTAVGIRAELEVIDWATQLERYQRGQFTLQAFSFSARFDPSLMLGAFVGSKDEAATAQWEDPRAIELAAESGRVSDPGPRRATFLELHRLMAEQVPIVGLYYDPSLEAWNPRIRGYRPWAANKPIVWGVWRADSR